METRDARALAEFAQAVERAGLRYVVGGSVAAGFFGEPRSTLDIDILIEAAAHDTERLVATLDPQFLVARDALHDALERRTGFNAYHRTAFTKFDVYVASADALDRAQLEHRRPKPLFDGSAEFVHVTSAELIVLRKLAWFRLGNLSSERQWRDVLGVLKHQRGRLDRALMDELASKTGLSYLLRRALEESAQG